MYIPNEHKDHLTDRQFRRLRLEVRSRTTAFLKMLHERQERSKKMPLSNKYFAAEVA